MIWFTCKQCGKTHGRPESTAGSLVFCECGQGNPVPWESTAAEPPAPTAPPISELPPVPKLEPVSFDRDRPPRSLSRPRRRGRYTPDPNFCLNHETTPSQKTCADCGESFCNDCTLAFQGITLCGPCKNYRVRVLHQSARVSTLALVSLFLALLTGPLGFCLMTSGSLLVSLLTVIPQVIAIVLGVLALRATEKDAKVGGQTLALTGILTASLSGILIVTLAVFAPGFGS